MKTGDMKRFAVQSIIMTSKGSPMKIVTKPQSHVDEKQDATSRETSNATTAAATASTSAPTGTGAGQLYIEDISTHVL